MGGILTTISGPFGGGRRADMYAVIQTGGKQSRVAPGDVIEVEKLPVAEGGEVP
jgi:large subunit ribosomal protein L21